MSLIEKELPPNPCWIEPAILTKRGKMLFGGHAKSFKSMLGLEFMRSLALGEPPCNCPVFSIPKACKVLLLEQELGPWILRGRLTKILAEAMQDPAKESILRENFKVLSQVRGLKLDTIEAVEAITQWCLELGTNVLFLDPIGKMHGYDENDNSQISRLFDRIERILDNCKANDLSIIISHHFGKPNRDPRVEVDEFSAYNFRGASKWYDDPDTLVTVVRQRSPTPSPTGIYLRTKWECRGGPPPFDDIAVFSVNKKDDLRVLYEPSLSLGSPGPSKSSRGRLDLSTGAVKI